MKYLGLFSLALMLVAGCQSSDLQSSTQKQGSIIFPEPRITKLHHAKILANGQVMDIPAPAVWPTAARDLPELKRWFIIGNITTLTYHDPDKSTYTLSLNFIYRDAASNQRHVGPFTVTRFRPNGTKEVETFYHGDALGDIEWKAYAADGVTQTAHVIQVARSDDGEPNLLRIEILRNGQMIPYTVKGTGNNGVASREKY